MKVLLVFLKGGQTVCVEDCNSFDLDQLEYLVDLVHARVGPVTHPPTGKIVASFRALDVSGWMFKDLHR